MQQAGCRLFYHRNFAYLCNIFLITHFVPAAPAAPNSLSTRFVVTSYVSLVTIFYAKNHPAPRRYSCPSQKVCRLFGEGIICNKQVAGFSCHRNSAYLCNIFCSVFCNMFLTTHFVPAAPYSPEQWPFFSHKRTSNPFRAVFLKSTKAAGCVVQPRRKLVYNGSIEQRRCGCEACGDCVKKAALSAGLGADFHSCAVLHRAGVHNLQHVGVLAYRFDCRRSSACAANKVRLYRQQTR